jgi:hypothetical protein
LNALAKQEIEPFIERLGLHQTSQAAGSYRFGYRAVATNDIISSVEIPTSFVEDMILRGSSLSVGLTPDGQVISELSFEHHAASSIEKWSLPLPLDQLICAALSPRNLGMEEATIEELTTLLQRLENSTMLVKAVLTRTEHATIDG